MTSRAGGRDASGARVEDGRALELSLGGRGTLGGAGARFWRGGRGQARGRRERDRGRSAGAGSEKGNFRVPGSATRGRGQKRPRENAPEGHVGVLWGGMEGERRRARFGREPSAWMWLTPRGPLGLLPPSPAPGDFISWPDALPRPSNTYPSPVAPAPFFLRTLIFSPSPPASVLSARLPLSG